MTDATLGVTGAALTVTGTEPIGPYVLLRVAAGRVSTGSPGQFFMLHPPGHVLPRPMSLCLAAAGELGFLIDPIGSGTRALCELAVGDTLRVLGPLGNGFDLTVRRPLLVGGGIGIAPFPFTSAVLGGPPAILGFRSAHHAEAAALVPGAEIALDPVLVTDLLPDDPGDVLACGPEPMLEAVRRARARRAARLGGADGLRLRRLLRLCRPDRRPPPAPLHCRTRPARGMSRRLDGGFVGADRRLCRW